MVSGDRVRALRYAREVVDDLRWRGMAVPPVYAGMAEEFRALVRSGGYTAWVAGRDQAAAVGAAWVTRPPDRGRRYASWRWTRSGRNTDMTSRTDSTPSAPPCSTTTR
jgi:hypothetical protein